MKIKPGVVKLEYLPHMEQGDTLLIDGKYYLITTILQVIKQVDNETTITFQPVLQLVKDDNAN